MPRVAPDPTRDLLAGCDPAQAEAITTTASPLLVLAGAGSGKTRVLTRRIAWRVTTGSAEAAHVLTVTFTRKAAAELRARLALLGLPESVTAGTFHALALAELRRLAAERNSAPPVVLGSKARLLYAVMNDRPALRARRGATPSGRPPVHELASEIEWAKARLLAPEEYARAAFSANRQVPVAYDEVAELYAAYETERARRRVLDFEDLLTTCRRELERDPAFAASARWRFRHLFVDEYQDVNAAQLALLRAWAGDNDDLCAVGDPDQAIYGWNGADAGAIAAFGTHFPGATAIRLPTNYRSTSEVLSVASAVLGRTEPPLAGGPSPEGPVPTVTAYRDDAAEAAGVAEAVRRAHRPGRLWSQIAVLARTNGQLAVVDRALSAAGVPRRLVGGDHLVRLPHVANALAELESARDRFELAALAADLRRPPPGEADEEMVGDRSAEADDLAALGELVEEYLDTDTVPSGAGLRAFIETATRAGGDGPRRDAVELLTFHRAKGLEWPVVFLVGLEDGLVPIAHARDEASLAEERRLLYVACTRAREELHCSWARERHFRADRPSPRSPSPYLGEIDGARRRLAERAARTPSAARRALEESRRALNGG